MTPVCVCVCLCLCVCEKERERREWNIILLEHEVIQHKRNTYYLEGKKPLHHRCVSLCIGGVRPNLNYVGGYRWQNDEKRVEQAVEDAGYLPVCLGSVAPLVAPGVLVWKHLRKTIEEGHAEKQRLLYILVNIYLPMYYVVLAKKPFYKTDMNITEKK